MKNKILTALTNNALNIETALKNYLLKTDTQYGILYDAMRYSVLGGGKRIRPFLTLEFCRLYGGSDEAALPFACAIEMIHTYSLIHDDLPCMDNDDYRRGQLTSHKKFGEANALLAGDALLTYAFEVTVSNKAVSPDTALKAVRILAVNAGTEGMVGGQQLDLLGEHESFDYDMLLRMNSLKTGRLIRAACLLGCLAAGQKDTSKALYYAERIGLAFQITDDILDDGEEDNKTTFLTFMSRDKARQTAERLTFEACGILDDTEGSETLRLLALYLLDRKQ
jgi:geranylgeranyl diphosphate synthase, type II